MATAKKDPAAAREEIAQKVAEYLRDTPPAKQSLAGFITFLGKG